MSTQEKGRHTPKGGEDTGATFPLHASRGMFGSDAWYTYVNYHHEGYLDKVGNNLLKDIIGYIDYGREPGGFLTAVFSNNLMNTIHKADGSIDMKIIHNIVRWLYNVPPDSAWGSKTAVNRWIKGRGLHGRWCENNKEFLEQLYERRRNNE